MIRLKFTLVLVTTVLYAALAYVAPSGMADSRIFGYTGAEIATWAQDTRALELARGPVHFLDTVFPAFLGASFIALIRRRVLWVLPVLYMAADYTENALLFAFYQGLSSGAELSVWASPMTQTKWAFVIASFVAVAHALWPKRGAA